MAHKQYKYNQMPDNEFTRALKEVHDGLNSKNIGWENIVWNGEKEEFIVQVGLIRSGQELADLMVSANALLAKHAVTSEE